MAPIAAGIKDKHGSALIVVSSLVRAKRLAQDLSFFYNGDIFTMPEEDEAFVRYDAGSRENFFNKMSALKALTGRGDAVVIAPVSCLLKRYAPHETITATKVEVVMGEELGLSFLVERLALMGYERSTVIDGRGQFAVRGDIVDVFAIDSEDPYRIEFFDDEVDSIRTFDVDTQRSIENLKDVLIYPATQVLYDDKTRELIEGGVSMTYMQNYVHYFYDHTDCLWDYVPMGGCIMVDDPDRVNEAVNIHEKEFSEDFTILLEKGDVKKSDFKALVTKGEFMELYAQPEVTLFTPFTKRINGVDELGSLTTVISKPTPSFNGHLDVFESELRTYLKHGYDVTIVCSTDERKANLQDFLSRSDDLISVKLRLGELTSGIEFPEMKKAWFVDSDIFGAAKRQRKKHPKSSNGQKISNFTDLKEGDYVVHENHGIGKFIGIQQLAVQGVKKDYIKIKYAGQDLLYVPVEQMDLVQKYIGGAEAAPKINKLSGGDWKITKAKAKQAIAEMAQDLIDLSAKRRLAPGYQFGPDTVWQAEFEDSFPYQETEDQLKCILEIKQDMESPVAMDRLLCGDVGFGKTEVAARAIFKCLAEGRQAAILVPTTLLANQHYYTLKERFERFPFTVEMLCRFRTEKQQAEIVEKAKKGQIDLIIGTHRLLSQDVGFKDLGLLVVDEEQRFGVQHKEAIKKLRENIDVLTLSATPIPRTLHMSLTGIRDMSIIAEPPEDRYPVQTYVLEQDSSLIKEIIERELGRGGQVYVVYNKVQGISKIAREIEELVPDAKVKLGHGQMNETSLENVMVDFINGDSNVLVSTTIVENGIDIPNANTMIVLNADHFGLSQLYQLRGRVGRSSRMAYCYLMYQKDKVLSETAEKRLRAIKEFTEFGSGFKVAMRDLEIRGAGNLLGNAQSGHMVNVGYELYCKMVDEAVRALQGEIVNPDREETSIELSVPALIPREYIYDEVTKLAMYKRIAGIRTEEDEDEVADELMDRFGEIPPETANLLKVSRIRAMAEQLGIDRIREEQATVLGKPVQRIVLDFNEKNNLKPEGLAMLTSQYGPRLLIHGGTKPFIRYTLQNRKTLLAEVLTVLFLLS